MIKRMSDATDVYRALSIFQSQLGRVMAGRVFLPPRLPARGCLLLRLLLLWLRFLLLWLLLLWLLSFLLRLLLLGLHLHHHIHLLLGSWLLAPSLLRRPFRCA